MPLQDKKFVSRQVMRMAGLRNSFRPLSKSENKAVFDELVKVLAACRTEEHAEYVIDEIMHTGEVCPSPAALRSLIYSYRDRFGSDAKRGCPDCTDGWRLVYLLVDMHGGHPDSKSAERATREQYQNLLPKIDHRKQMLYEAVEKVSMYQQRQKAAQLGQPRGKELQ